MVLTDLLYCLADLLRRKREHDIELGAQRLVERAQVQDREVRRRRPSLGSLQVRLTVVAHTSARNQPQHHAVKLPLSVCFHLLHDDIHADASPDARGQDFGPLESIGGRICGSDGEW